MVAREGERATPVVAAPTQLRRYLNFARLPDPALEVARRVLDDDPAFRERVAMSTGEVVVGRAGWLFLDRSRLGSGRRGRHRGRSGHRLGRGGPGR